MVSLLEARGLRFGHGRPLVDSEVDVGLSPGQVLCLLGPNGSGKTTLLRTLSGLLAPLGGAVLVEGVPVERWRRTALAQVLAYVPQAHAVPFPFSVEEVVLAGRTSRLHPFAAPSARDRDAARCALATLGVEHLRGRTYDGISGGERQLVLLARALAQEPRILVLDEPTASLDLANQGTVLERIRQLAERGMAIVWASHDPDHALLCADLVALLGRGRLLRLGPPPSALTPQALEEVYGVEIAIGRIREDGRAVCAPVYPWWRRRSNAPCSTGRVRSVAAGRLNEQGGMES